MDLKEYGKLVKEATYINYKYNRERSPDVTPEEWGKVFQKATELEARYQEEITHAS
jgi:NAD-dependent DNA ligase